MATRDLHNVLKDVLMLKAQTLSADTNSTSIDTQFHEGLQVMVNVGKTGNATLSSTVKIDFELEESDDNTTFSDVAEADILGAVSGTTVGLFKSVNATNLDESVYSAGYRGAKRYVRCVVNFSGTHGTGTPISVTGVLGASRHQPV